MVLEDDGDLRLSTAIGDLTLRRPVAWQRGSDNGRHDVEARFVVDAQRRVGFVLGDYDRSRDLTIDPVLSYAALFGSEDNTTLALGIGTDAAGAIYVSGSTCSLQYPVVAGALKAQGGEIFGYDPCEDAFVTKLDPSGKALVYSTFLGGADRETAARLAVDASGAAYLTGVTLSSDFPTTSGAVQRGLNGARTCRLPDGPLQICADAFVVKLSADGSSLAYSTLLGGSGFDLGLGIALDAAGSAYVQGWTNSNDFPTTAGAFDRSYGGGSCSTGGVVPCFDAWVAKLAPDGNSLAYSTHLGGSSREYGGGIAVDGAGNAYVTGATLSANFPTTPGAYRTTHTSGTQEDGYLVKLNPGGTALVWATLFGGAGIDVPYELALDANDGVIVVGTTDSTDFPTTTGALKTTNTAPAFACSVESLRLIVCGEAFALRFTPDGAGLVFSTYLGGSGSDAAFSVVRDAGGDYWIGGQTQSMNFPITSDALNTTNNVTGGFVAQLAGDGSTLRFSTPLKVDTVIGLRTGAGGAILGGGTGARSPSTPDAFLSDATHSGPYLFRLSAGTAPQLTLTPTSISLFSVVGGTSAPKTVTITNPSTVPTRLRLVISDFFGANSSDAENVLETDDCPATLTAGTSCTASLYWRPTVTGSRSGYLRVLSNSINAPHLVPVGGGASTILDGVFQPSTLTFAPRAAGTQSEVLAASLVNQGEVGATNRGYTVTGPNAADFTFDNINCQVDSFCTLNVRFAPMAGADGPRSATVGLTTDLANNPKQLQLQGSVTSGAANTLSTTQLDFGPVRNNSGDTRQVQLRNGGAAALTGVGVTLSGSDYSIDSNSCGTGGGTVAAQALCNVNVRLTPMGTGVRTGTLTISNDAPPASPQSVALTGLAVDPAGPYDIGFVSGKTDFGPVVVGTTSSVPALVTIQNLGGADMTGVAVSTTGDFTQTNNCGSAVVAGSSCTISSNFAPTAEGAASGSVRVVSNAPGSPRVVALTGTGVRLPLVTLTPAKLDFGSVASGRTSGPLVATLRNAGTAPLNITSLGVPAPFTQTNTCSATIAAAASCTITLGFAPAVAGPASALLSIVTNAPGRLHTTGVRGLGVAGNALGARPRSLDFGTQAVSAASAPQTVAITNTGAGTVTLKGIAVARNYAQTNDCGTSLAAGASCSITVQFVPTRPSPLNTITIDGPISIAGDFDGSPLLVPLRGIGVTGGPGRSLSPGSLPFGSIATGATTTGDLTLNSTGTVPLVISSALIGGANASDFTLVAPGAGRTDCRSTASLAVGTSCVYRLQFAPVSAGSKLATLTITDNAAGSPVLVGLSGNATAGSGGGGSGAAVMLSSMSVAAAATTVGATTTAAPVTLTNSGSAALAISGVTLGGADAAQFSQSNNCGTSVAAGASCAITVTFAPTSAGPKAASIAIASNGSGSPHSIVLSGTAGDFALAPGGVSTVSVAAGQTASLPIAVSTSGGALSAAVSFSASGNPAGTTVTFSPATLAAGSTSGMTTMSIATTSRTAALREPPSGLADSRVLVASVVPSWAALWICAMLLGVAFRSYRRGALVVVAIVAVLTPALIAGCGGGGGGGGSGGGMTSGTPVGSYTITVTATSAGVARTTQVTLAVT